jgi:hypothetical protein
MTPKLNRTGKKNLLIILMASIAVLLNGCNASDLSTANSLTSKRITEILLNEEDTSWNCIIKGSNTLTFSVFNHLSPTGILLFFPDTSLDIPATDPRQPANEIIDSIEANEFTDGNFKNSRILIGLKVDRPYSISPAENGLKISFPKTLVQTVDGKKIKISAETKAVVADVPSFSPASRLKTVTATSLTTHIVVNVTADGAITNYKSFVLENPARIVFDIDSIKSPHQEGQALPVNSPWVKRIRYNPYPDKIRLVLDTQKQFLTKYFSFPTASGMLIYVGRMPEPLRKR